MPVRLGVLRLDLVGLVRLVLSGLLLLLAELVLEVVLFVLLELLLRWYSPMTDEEAAVISVCIQVIPFAVALEV